MHDDTPIVHTVSIQCDAKKHADCPHEIHLTMNQLTYLIFRCPCACHVGGVTPPTKPWNVETELKKFIKALKGRGEVGDN